MISKVLATVGSLFLSSMSFAALPIGTIPKEIRLEGDSGGKISGGGWSSKDFLGKVQLIFHVHPDAKDDNESVEDVLLKENFPGENFASIAVINMQDLGWFQRTFVPGVLKSKQKKTKRTIYIEDKAKVFVKEWGLAHKSSNIVVLDKAGKVLFSVDGKLKQEEIASLVSTIKKELDLLKKPSKEAKDKAKLTKEAAKEVKESKTQAKT